MSEREIRSLDRQLRAQGKLGEFVRTSMEDMREGDLFEIKDCAERLLKERATKAPSGEAPDLEHGRTSRGFTHMGFEDLYGEGCSLQMSSLATQAAVWLGIDNQKVLVFAPAGTDVSVQLNYKDGNSGWADAEIGVTGNEHASVLQSGRMHLSQDLIKLLLPSLQHFAAHGKLPHSPAAKS